MVMCSWKCNVLLKHANLRSSMACNVVMQVACRLAVSRSLGDMQFKVERSTEEGDGGADGNAPLKRKEQLVSPEPEMKSIRLAPRDRVVIVASGTALRRALL